jgi:lysophospholipase L1-like esterase
MACPPPRIRLSLLLVLSLLWVVAAAVPALAADRPLAAVSMGDSVASGEAAGDYDPATNQPGNYCHRSANAEIHRTAVPGVERTINLACSGATTANVRLGGESRYGEAPQAEQLRAVAADYTVKLVLVSVGANDIGFSDLVRDCVTAFVPELPDCQLKWDPLIDQRSNDAVPGIVAALNDIRSVMRDAGYADADWQLVLQGYASPVPARMRPLGWWGQFGSGCPVDATAMNWAHETVLPRFSRMSREAADAAGARYMELAGAFDGHEVCAEGATAETEWARGLFVDPAQVPAGLGFNLVQQSMHPNALGHGQIGGCLTEFAARGETWTSCRIGSDGNLHPA